MKKKQYEMKRIEEETDIKLLERYYIKAEQQLYDRIIDVLEYNVNTKKGHILEYNNIPVTIGKRGIVRLSIATMGYDSETVIPFKPLKTHRHCIKILDWIQEHELPTAELYSTKEKLEKGFIYNISLRDNTNTYSTATSTKSEVDARFRCLYYYLFGTDEDTKDELDEVIRRIYSFDRKVKRRIAIIKSEAKKERKRKAELRKQKILLEYMEEMEENGNGINERSREWEEENNRMVEERK